MDLDTRRRAFHQLHSSGCFVMPNPWDIGSTRALAGLGFKALATTSAGFAWSMGCRDNNITLQNAIDHLTAIAAAVDLPINADFEGGFAIEPDGVAANVTRAVATGIAGLSIEDSTGNPDNPLFDLPLAVDRIRAARRAIDQAGAGVVLTARSEGFIAGRPDLSQTIARLTAYAEAGADCLYAPGIKALPDLAALIKAVAPKPVNVLVHVPFATVAQAADRGARRISGGGPPARAAWSGFLDPEKKIASRGTFSRSAETRT